MRGAAVCGDNHELWERENREIAVGENAELERAAIAFGHIW
jgi:hypothetical protein